MNDINSNKTQLLCKDGLIVPAAATTLFNAILYLFALLYCFLGTAIAADIFMCSIEKIVTTTRKVKQNRLKKDRLVADEMTGPNEGVEVHIWNPTVANLTLMALGSSAPEILLSIIEIVANQFRAGDLGPGTIVGSAAFNLLCITAVCILVVPSPKVKRIQEISVFAVTSLFSCLAYIWLLIILVVISPNVVEVWEALLTFAFFILLIIVAYLADIKIWKRKKARLEEELQMDGGTSAAKQTLIEQDGDIDAYLKRFAKEMMLESDQAKAADVVPDHETLRRISRWISHTYPNLSPDEQSKLLASKLEYLQDHDRLWYRIQAARRMSGAGKVDFRWDTRRMQEEADRAQTATITERMIEFSARVYSIAKGSNRVTLRVVRYGPNEKPLTFRYSTKNGVAKRDLHFLAKSETVQFRPGEAVREIYVDLIEDAKWRPNHVFYVHLKLLPKNDEEERVTLGRTNVASILVPDDSASFIGEPMVQFVKNNYVVKENEKYVRAFVTRLGRHDECTFSIRYETEAVTAKCDEDYKGISDGVLMFVGSEYEKYIDVRIYDDMDEEKDETFSINLISSTGAVTIGPNKRTIITIICDDNLLRNITNVRKLTSHYLKRMTYGADTWRGQLVEAASVNAGDIENATFMDCIMHILSFPWKILAALVPPANILGGWLAFFCALLLIGFITAVVGDLASIFGCMVGLKDSITAITLVALGTSLPDTFASKIAAKNDATADNAIGNVTGSNAVNVFLGLGLPWTVAAIYWAIKNQAFVVNAGSLGFSVAVFMTSSAFCLALLMARRMLSFFGKGELGGPVGPKALSCMILFLLWLAYVILSVLQAYGHISV